MKFSALSRVPMPRQRIPLKERISEAWRVFSVSHREDREAYIRRRTEMLRVAFGALDSTSRFAAMQFVHDLPAAPMRIPTELNVKSFIEAVETLEAFEHQCELVAHVCEINPNLAAHKALVSWADKNRQKLAA